MGCINPQGSVDATTQRNLKKLGTLTFEQETLGCLLTGTCLDNININTQTTLQTKMDAA